MPLTELTIFTAPKPFTDGHIATIQRNAILSWLSLGEQVEVLLVGDETGMAEVASQYGIRQLSDVACNENGTPLVSSIFTLARQASDSPLLVYVNADMILLPDLITAAQSVARQVERFLIIGQRWDLEITQLLDFSPGWEAWLYSEVSLRGRLHPPAGSDYFIFPRQSFSDLPPFAIGRAGWDNWMIYHARQQGWPVVDGTPSIQVIHQSHDYSHLPEGQPHYNLPESRQNEALAGGATNLFMVLDSDRQLVDGSIRRPRLTLPRLLRRIEIFFTPPGSERVGWRWLIARRFRRLRRRITGSL
jgi:hypothetical protein